MYTRKLNKKKLESIFCILTLSKWSICRSEFSLMKFWFKIILWCTFLANSMSLLLFYMNRLFWTRSKILLFIYIYVILVVSVYFKYGDVFECFDGEVLYNIECKFYRYGV